MFWVFVHIWDEGFSTWMLKRIERNIFFFDREEREQKSSLQIWCPAPIPETHTPLQWSGICISWNLNFSHECLKQIKRVRHFLMSLYLDIMRSLWRKKKIVPSHRSFNAFFFKTLWKICEVVCYYIFYIAIAKKDLVLRPISYYEFGQNYIEAKS